MVSATGLVCPDFLLLHQLRIRAVVDHAFSKHRGRERAVYFLRIDIFQLAIEDKLISLRPKTYCRLLPQQNKGKDIAILN